MSSKSLHIEKYSGKNIWRAYVYLTKPGIITGNFITTLGGFLLGAKGAIQIFPLLGVLTGMTLCIGCACVLNNYIDRDIDTHMQRTKKRTAIIKLIPTRNALIYAFFLGITGVSILFMLTNFLVLLVSMVGFIFYIGIYPYTKRKTIYGTQMGAISGAVPLTAGYLAATHRLDLGALLLFLILVIWQMPHFYAISIFRLKDYAKAKIPALSVKHGVKTTKIYIVFYIVLLGVLFDSLTFFGISKLTYLLVMKACILIWFFTCIQGIWTQDDDKWAHKVFGFSLITLLVFSLMISLDSFLP